jgi:hypothetical protein
MSQPSKTCSKCEVTKKVSEFHKCADGKYGVHSICKPCRISAETERATEWKKKNRAKYLATQKAYYERKKARALA